LIYTSQDRRIFASLLPAVGRRSGAAQSVGELATEIGTCLLGTPYAAGTLERTGPEELVINLRQMDCFTFVENALALARVIQSGKASFEAYAAELTAIRYRQGQPAGYSSRLHYFSDWIFENQRKGILKNFTRALGGEPCRKKIDFMTKNEDRYPPLRNPETCRKIKDLEKKMRRRICYRLPKRLVKRTDGRISDGDLIAVTAAAEGLDVMHCGLAVRIRGKIHLLHASAAARKVAISADTLDRYLAGSEGRTGILVARAVECAKN
jgi:hypothetical protein